MQLAQVPTQAVVQAARDGDPAALDALVSGYLPLVYNVIGHAADSDLDVDDIVQDTMLHVVAGLPGLRDTASARSWVLAIAVRQLTDARRRAKGRRARQVPAAPEQFDRVDPASDFVSLSFCAVRSAASSGEVARPHGWPACAGPGAASLVRAAVRAAAAHRVAAHQAAVYHAAAGSALPSTVPLRPRKFRPLTGWPRRDDWTCSRVFGRPARGPGPSGAVSRAARPGLTWAPGPGSSWPGRPPSWFWRRACRRYRWPDGDPAARPPR